MIFFGRFLMLIFLGMASLLQAQPTPTQKLYDDVLACKKNDDIAISIALSKLYEALKKDPEAIQHFRKLLAQKERLDIQKSVIDYFRAVLEKPENPKVVQDALQIFPQVLVFLHTHTMRPALRKVPQQFLQELQKHINLHEALTKLIGHSQASIEERIAATMVFWGEYNWSKETLGQLIQLLSRLNGEEKDVSKAVSALLEYWTGLQFGDHPNGWTTWWEKNKEQSLLVLKEEIIRNKNQQLDWIREQKSQEFAQILQEKEKQFENTLLDLLTKAYPEQLFKVLVSPSAKVRKFAVEKIGAGRLSGAVDKLIELLRDPSAEVRSASIQALIKLKDVRTLDAFLLLLQETQLSLEDIQIILEGLDSFKTPETMPKIMQVLFSFLQHSISAVRATAALELGNLGESQAIPVLMELLKTDLIPEVQEACVQSLGHLKAKEAVTLIIQLGLTSKENSLRWHSIDALGAIGDKQAVGPLKQHFQNETVPLVQAVILSSLGSLRDVESLPLFQQSLKENRDKIIRQKAAQNFHQVLSGKETLADFVPLLDTLRDPEATVTDSAWSSLENILSNYPQFFEMFEEYLYNEAFKQERILELKQRVFFHYGNRLIALYEQKRPNEELGFTRLLRKGRCQYYLEFWSPAQITYPKLFALKPPSPEKEMLEFEYIDILLETKNFEEAGKKLLPYAELTNTSPFFPYKKYLTAKLRYLQQDLSGVKKELESLDLSGKTLDSYLQKKCLDLLK